MMEKLEKIRKILGKDYHLCVGVEMLEHRENFKKIIGGD